MSGALVPRPLVADALSIVCLAEGTADEYVREGWEPGDEPYELDRFPDDAAAAATMLRRELTGAERGVFEERVRARMRELWAAEGSDR